MKVPVHEPMYLSGRANNGGDGDGVGADVLIGDGVGSGEAIGVGVGSGAAIGVGVGSGAAIGVGVGDGASDKVEVGVAAGTDESAGAEAVGVGLPAVGESAGGRPQLTKSSVESATMTSTLSDER